MSKPRKPHESAARSANETLVASGLVELALGALSGWPYALAIDDPEAARRLGVRSVGRLRQWHLDLIALGALTVLVGSAVPDLPRRVAWPLALGAWTNANAFGVLALRPELKEHPVYKASVVASFATVSWGCCGLAAVGVGRSVRDVPPRSSPVESGARRLWARFKQAI